MRHGQNGSLGSAQPETAPAQPTDLFVYNGGFLTQKRIRRILDLSGYNIRLGKPTGEDLVGIWGQSPTAYRGQAIADRTHTPILRVEDAFLRSVLPGRAKGGPPLGLLLDRRGLHFDPSQPSDIEHILATHPLDDTVLLDRARNAMARLQRLHLSKYNAFDPALAAPDPGYVLIIDQTAGDASVTASGATSSTFQEMLAAAKEAHPGTRILILSHPETQAGARPGHFTPQDATGDVSFHDAPVSPWALLDGAIAVYTVSSQMGFEAILAGHRPHVFGQPFYAGWGLSCDENPLARRGRNLTKAQLFAGAMILAPTWYDPYRDRLCDLETAIDILAAEVREWRDDHAGWHAAGMRLWKRKHLQSFFGRYRPVRFSKANKESRRQMGWAGKPESVGKIRVEDGFLRSRGLGASLIPPLSLVLDDLGIYYDPRSESRLERLVAARATLPPDDQQRAIRLQQALIQSNATKYNLSGGPLPDLPDGQVILVPGQVEDDASIKTGCQDICTNAALLEQTRARNPDAVIAYKPHPDVEAGLRPGAIPEAEALQWADVVLNTVSAHEALANCDAVWTLTSSIGFEALIRGLPVTCLGTPFYAGWGLTTDLGDIPARRTARVSIAGLIHAALIDYPRYLDPITKRPCPVEVALERLSEGDIPRPGLPHRLLSKLQGVFAGQAHLWR